MAQGEWWQGHDGSNATTVGTGANGACLNTAVCGGSGAPGMQRRTYYVLAKYLITDGLLQNFEPTFMWEQFDPNTTMSNDMYTRTILGLTYYFENFPPKVQSKIQFNYEFRHHQGILAGGLGTRMRGTLGDLPKPLAPIGDKPFLEYLLKFVSNQQFRDVIISLGYGSEAVKEYINELQYNMFLCYTGGPSVPPRSSFPR